MVPARRHPGPMVQVRMVMVAESLRGLAGALVSAEVSVGAGAAVAAEADLVIGGRYK